MNAADVIERLAELGVTLRLGGPSGLAARPSGRLTPDARRHIEAHRSEIIAELRRREVEGGIVAMVRTAWEEAGDLILRYPECRAEGEEWDRCQDRIDQAAADLKLDAVQDACADLVSLAQQTVEAAVRKRKEEVLDAARKAGWPDVTIPGLGRVGPGEAPWRYSVTAALPEAIPALTGAIA